MLKQRLFASVVLLARFAPIVLAQPKPPQEFQADSQIGEFYLIGATRSTADGKMVDTAEHLLISLDSARLALRFPNLDSNTVSGENQQLLLLSGTFRNPQKEQTSVPGGTPVLVRIFGSTAGQVYHLETFLEQESLQQLNATLKPNQSVRYTIVLLVPAENPAMKISLRRRDGPSRKYDLRPVLTRPASVFLSDGFNVSSFAKASLGRVFDLDAFDLKVVAVREAPKIGSYTSAEGKRLYVVEMQVTNRMLRAEKWGWQYCTPDLKDVAEKSIPWNRDMLDAQSGQTFSRDLAAGETATVLYVFSSDTKLAPGTLSLKMVRTKRQVDIALSPF